MPLSSGNNDTHYDTLLNTNTVEFFLKSKTIRHKLHTDIYIYISLSLSLSLSLVSPLYATLRSPRSRNYQLPTNYLL